MSKAGAVGHCADGLFAAAPPSCTEMRMKNCKCRIPSFIKMPYRPTPEKKGLPSHYNISETKRIAVVYIHTGCPLLLNFHFIYTLFIYLLQHFSVCANNLVLPPTCTVVFLFRIHILPFIYCFIMSVCNWKCTTT